jgi:hypothetical protein
LALLCGKVTLGPQLKPKANCAKQIFTVLENSAPRLYQSLRERDGDLIDRFRWAEILAHLQQNGRASHMADKMEASVFSTLREHAFATHRMSLKQNALYLMAYLRYAEYSAGGGIGFSLRESQRYFLEAEVRTLDDAYYCVSALAGKAPWLTVKVTKSHILLEQLSLTGVILPFHRTLQVRMNDTSVPFAAVSDS